MVKSHVQRLGASRFVVTRGRKGCITWTRDRGFVEVPALSLNVLDRVGAGDAFFSLSSLVACLGEPGEVLGFLGNAAGGLAVQTVGNAKPVDKLALKKFITALLK